MGTDTRGDAAKYEILNGLLTLEPNYNCLKDDPVKTLQHWVRYQTALPEAFVHQDSTSSVCPGRPFVCSCRSAARLQVQRQPGLKDALAVVSDRDTLLIGHPILHL